MNTRSHPELGREKLQRRWYCVLRRGRVGRRQACQGQVEEFAALARFATLECGMGCQSPHRDHSPLSRVGLPHECGKPLRTMSSAAFVCAPACLLAGVLVLAGKRCRAECASSLVAGFARLCLGESGVKPLHHTGLGPCCGECGLRFVLLASKTLSVADRSRTAARSRRRLSVLR